ncbi:Pentatricopeptide repeat-containing protein [Ananas comosus]|uniref:Pentatricopeptide repeat-containing protein n=1 Tax=Ananas comosus TaxID=4615 RepID=A0A199WAV1_ANACO|nr:Pentatricopeptide repeat-containing protein [Ananas comosus]
MQSLNAFYLKGATLGATATHLDSDEFYSHALRKRRKRRWFCGRGGCAQTVSVSCNFGGFRGSSRNCGTQFITSCPKFSLLDRKKSPLSRYSATVSALEQETVGNEHRRGGPESKGSTNKEVSLDILNDVGNCNIFYQKEEEGEKVMGRGRNDRSRAAESIEKEKVDVRALAFTLRDAKTADDVEKLSRSLENLPLPVYSSMIRGLGSDKRLDAAFAIVEWLKRKKAAGGASVAPNLFIYNSLLSAVKQTERFEKVNEVIEDMKSQGIVPNIVTYNTLMSIHLEQGKPCEALDILAQIENYGLSPSPVTYSTVLLAYKKMDDARGAIGFFVKLREKYEKGEIGRDAGDDWENEFFKLEKFLIRVCYVTMHRLLVNEENPTADVVNLLSCMDNAGIKPDRTDYERLVWACTREDHYTVAKELYRRVREMDGEISLSVCNHVIWLMGKAKKWWAALEIYEDLLDKGPKPNNLSYELIISHFNILLTAARRRGIWRWGVRLLNKMQDKGLRPGSREWNAVLVACSKASETNAANGGARREATVLSYGALLSALEKGKLYEEALAVWEHMCKVDVKPNLHAYTILASIFIGKGNIDMVDSIIREMLSAGIEPTVVTFNAIISGCAKNNMGSAAFEWFHRMKVRNIKPNKITYEMLIETLAKDGKPRLAYEMYLRACNERLNLSSRSYDAVVAACQAYSISIDRNAMGPRPVDKRKNIMIRKNMSDFCNFADLPRRVKPLDKTEIYNTYVQER